jgi:hypothetical protein
MNAGKRDCLVVKGKVIFFLVIRLQSTMSGVSQKVGRQIAACCNKVIEFGQGSALIH